MMRNHLAGLGPYGYICILLILLAGVVSIAVAAYSEAPLPANAYRNSSAYGLGSECKRGYRPVDATCVAAVLPANAHLN
ncbi:MAG: hypothetical protein V2J12_06055 [Gammaproteobacteria bacterium]|jgi:hypothetical protein|nr:hypothetical protein [Gammaproteobacteria bacterium]